MVNTLYCPQAQGLSLPSSTSQVGAGKPPPTTPMRRFLCKAELMRPFLALGKRNRDPLHAAASVQVPVPPATTAAAGAGGLCLLATAAVAEAASHSLSVRPLNWGQPHDYAFADTSNALSDSVSDRRDHDHPNAHAPIAPPTHHDQHPQRARLAIQQHDQPLDAIVITTLPQYPFCCHEDLLTMSRSQLVEVAALFNAHLPCTSSALIDVSETTSEAHMRHCIEVLCGIVPLDVPAAPKAVRSRVVQACIGPGSDGGVWRCGVGAQAQEDLGILLSPPSSPLAMRLSRRRGVVVPPLLASTSGVLERLDEDDEECDFEEEGDVFDNHRAFKRRKLSDAFVIPIRTLYGYGRTKASTTTSRDQKMVVDTTPTRTPTRHSRSLAFTTHRLLRAGDGDDDSSSDVDMSMQSPSPLQHRSRTFGVPPLVGSKTRLGHGSSKSIQRSTSKRARAQAQQICRPMGKLRMNSDPPSGVAF